MYVASGSAYAYRIEFTVDEEFVVPDPGSVYFTLQDNALNFMGGFNGGSALTVPPGTTSFSVNIPGAANARTLPYEIRSVTAWFKFNGRTYTIRDNYILRDNLNFPLTPQDVRGLLGVSSSEIADETIDIFKAYDDVQDDAGTGFNLTTLMSTGDLRAGYIIPAVKHKAAINLLATIQSSMFQTEQADNTIYGRFDKIDFAGMTDQLTKKYSLLLNKITLVTDPIAPTLSQVNLGTDPVTNK